MFHQLLLRSYEGDSFVGDGGGDGGAGAGGDGITTKQIVINSIMVVN